MTDVDRRDDQDARRRLSEIQVGYERWLSEIQAGYERWAHRTFAALIVMAVTFVATIAIVGYLIHENGKATNALCTLRGDLEQRAVSTRNFIASHPNGIPGIPIATLRTGLVSQERTIRSLASLNCKGRT